MSRRWAAKADTNQREIVAVLRAAGATVQHLHSVGDGCADLLVGYKGQNYLLEVKLPGEELNKRQWEWHFTWKGDCSIVRSKNEALAAIGCGVSDAD